MDDKQYLQRLISEGEHQQQDFKYRVSDARKLARSVSAFANTDGGRLLIGVRDDGHIPRQKVITLLARLIRFNIVQCRHQNQQFLFSLNEG